MEEARLAWELAGNIITSREAGQLQERPRAREERPSVAAREGPPAVERGRQSQELQR